MKQDRLARILIAIVLLLFIFLPLASSGLDLLVDWLWFGAEGYRSIYLTLLKAQIGLSTAASFGFMIAVAVNLLIARSVAHRHSFRVYSEVIEFPALDRFAKLFRALVWLGVLLVGYIVGEWATTHTLDYLLAGHAQVMHQADPLFAIDLGFYLFRLPFRWFLYHLGIVTVIISALATAFMYFVEGGVYLVGRGVSIVRGARAHLMILGALLFILLAYRARLAMYDLLYSAEGLIYGAGYTDIHATLPVLWILLVLCIVTALAFAVGAQTGRLRAPVGAIVALVAVWIVGGGIYPALLQRFIVAPNEIDKEYPYIARAIEFTRKAYALDRFHEHEFSAMEDLSFSDMQANDATLRNVRLWDHKPLLTTFAQLQEIRTYYDFVGVDNDRYWINNTYRQVSLSPRELSSASLPSRNWINEHLIYTHGYGLCMGPVNESTPDGLPVFFVKDIPPSSDASSVRVTRPEIYYGEVPNSYCFVDTHLKEFDYPAGDQNVYTSYAGSGGIEVRNIWRRLLFALKFGELKILLSSDIQPQSRLMIYRNIIDRAGRLTPFLHYDNDPYMVIAADGSLYWILDAYTTSSQYPYSEPYGDVGNYIRNSVKATINAYTGQVRFYVSDPTDPLIQSYSSMFPGVFQPLSAMPVDLRAHIRYPEDFFSIQASKYAVYHMTDPRVFYNKEDLWRVALSSASGDTTPMSPYYTIMKLAEVGKTEEFILMVPFTPARKQNMIAWMAARCDAPNYGNVLVFTFPKQKLVYGPQQIESRINQDPSISQQLTLWDQGGSKVIRGTLLVIPVRNSVLYVEPLYLTSQSGGGLPQLKRVIVSYSDYVVMQPSLDAALSSIFGGNIQTAPLVASAGAPPSPGGQGAGEPGASSASAATTALTPQTRSLIQQANQHFERAQQLLRQGDWSGYGVEIKKVGDLLRQLSVPGRSSDK